VQLSEEQYNGQTCPISDLPEEPKKGYGPYTMTPATKVVGWAYSDYGERIANTQTFEQLNDPVLKEEDDKHFSRRVLMHRRLCEVAMQMHRIRETEDHLMNHMIFSAGEHKKVGMQNGDGRVITPFKGKPEWNERMFHTLENILGITEADEPECYTVDAMTKIKRMCRSVKEWHPDKCQSFTAGPRAEKIRSDWFNMIGIAHDVMSNKQARERYWKYGIWTDKNLSREDTAMADLRLYKMYFYHPRPLINPPNETDWFWVMKDATDWQTELEHAQEDMLLKVIQAAPVMPVL